MPKTLDDVLSALKGHADGAELAGVVNALKASADASTTDAETARRERSTLHSTHSKLVDSLKALGFESGDPVSFASTLKEKLDKGSQDGQKLTGAAAENAALNQRLKALEDKNSKAEQKAAQLAQRTLRETLNGMFKGRVWDPEGSTALVLQNGLASVNEEGSPVWKDGVDFEKGVNEFIAARPNIQVNNQVAGSGSGGATGGKSCGKIMNRGEFSKLPPVEQAKLSTEGITLTD